MIIAGNWSPRNAFFRVIWRNLAPVARDGVHIYMTKFDASLTETTWFADDATIYFPGIDSFIPGCLNGTMMSIHFIKERRLPGHDAPLFLRTNLATFWNMTKVLSLYLPQVAREFAEKELYGGITYILPQDTFIRGNAIFLNQRSLDLLLRSEHELDYNVIDDISIGRTLRKHKVFPVFNMVTCMFEARFSGSANDALRSCHNDTIAYQDRK